MNKKNWFNTLNEALESEGLVHMWPFGLSMSYDSNERIIKDGVFMTIYRDSDGRYERPISYKTNCTNSHSF